MRTVVNKTREPIRIPLPRGKVLHLGPAKTGQISDEATERAAVKKLVKAGKIEILEAGDQGSAGREASGTIHESTHGRAQSTVVHRRGNR